jgi:hypothetical protein
METKKRELKSAQTWLGPGERELNELLRNNMFIYKKNANYNLGIY